MLAFRYPVSQLGLDIVSIDETEFGWGIIFNRADIIHGSWETTLLTKWQKAGYFKLYTKAHIKYVWQSLSAQGIHRFEAGHIRGWNWDYCPSLEGMCTNCDQLVITSHVEKVNRYYYGRS